VDFDITGQLLIIYSAIPKKCEKKWVYDKAVHQLFIVINQTYNSDIREVLFSLSLVITMKLVSLIKTFLMKPIAESRAEAYTL